MNMDKKRKKATITRPTHSPPHAPTSVQVETVSVPSHMAPPPPDTNSPVFTKNPVPLKNPPSFLGAIFKTMLFCLPVAVVTIGGILFYAQNQVIRILPEMKTVYRTLGITQPYASFKDIHNTPLIDTPLIAHVTQFILQDDRLPTQDTKNRIYGIIYNTTTDTAYTSATVVVEFLSENNTPITTQTHTINTPLAPSAYTAFEIPLSYVPAYAKNVRIQFIK